MNKQTEIRNGMRKIIDFCGNEPDVCVGELEMYLDKIGVVIKGYNLPSHPHLANYYTVEPLIEEKE